MIRTWRGLIAALGLVACSPVSELPTPETSETSPSTGWQEIDSPVGRFSFAPGLAVVDGELILSWLERTETAEGKAHHQLLVSRLRPDGWTTPSWVASGSDFFANWADTPAVAAAEDGTLFSHWLAKTDADTYAYSIFMARSDDGGENWVPLGPLNDDNTPTEHGFVSYVPEGDGVRAFWLDGRQMVEGGDMTFRTAWVGDDVGPAEVLDDRVCECCSASAAATDQGPVAVFRDRSAEEIRDIGIVRRLAEAWTATAAVATDNWMIEGCPVNGPEIVATGKNVAVAWYTAGGSGPRVQIAFSGDAGQSFGPPRVVDSGRPMGRVDLVWDEAGRAIVSWLEGGDTEAEIRLRRFSADGVGGEPIVVARTSPSRASGFPAWNGSETISTWPGSISRAKRLPGSAFSKSPLRHSASESSLFLQRSCGVGQTVIPPVAYNTPTQWTIREDMKTDRNQDPLGQDLDPQETREWKEALEEVIERDGPERAHFLIESLVDKARRSGAYLPYNATTAYVNTIPVHQEEQRQGDPSLERRIKSIIRWNAMAMVVKANRDGKNLGGHIATYQSAANLLEIGFNHFFRGPDAETGSDLVMIQGHSSPGVYARAFLEGRLTEQQLSGFRQEVDKKGLPSYPHPWLMPDFWRFPTVSMGLTSITAIYHARFMKYLHNRGVLNTAGRKVWAFLGDGEMDEPESLGAISLASREQLDNLIFVVNCNLQRLDGPVRGNGKIIQELESVFRGAGWNVIKVIWGSNWDPLLARDHSGRLRQRMEEVVDGQYQAYLSSDGAFIREDFFGKYPETAEMVADMSDEEIWRLKRGGHDPQKVYAAYAAAVKHTEQPTVILAQTVKGYGMGESGEGQNITHQQKKMGEESLRQFRDRFNIPVAEDRVEELPFYKPAEDSATSRYLRERREALGGFIPSRRVSAEPLEIPDLTAFNVVTEGSGDREVSTTMGFVRLLMALSRDKSIKEHIVPIVADEARTFGMEGMFRQVGIYAPTGQLYTPEDADQLAYYREEKTGQILQEGITEAGSLSSWIAAGTAHANHGIHMVPFFIFYSMFGFQRVADLIWAAADMRAKGFLMGATSGRTTLNGEGLQHQDGHSHLISATVPNCHSYDPTYGYELAVLLWDGLKKMYGEGENAFYYITLLNENYQHPPMPEGVEEGICKGMYLLREAPQGGAGSPRVQLMGSGSILREVLAAADLLQEDFGVAADVWSVTSFTELRREGLKIERSNRLHPKADQQRSYVEECLDGREGPVVASTDYMRSYADQIRPFVSGRYVTLGTDGFGRSDTRARLRSFFEVDRHHVVVAALKALADEGTVVVERIEEAIKKFALDAEAPPPWTV